MATAAAATEPAGMMTQLPDSLSTASFTFPPMNAIDDSQVCEMSLSWSLRKYEQVREQIMHEPGFWVFAALYAPAGLVGLMGNALTIYIFAAKMKRTPTSTFVIALAVVDLCVCLAVIPSRFVSILLINFGSDVLCKGSELVFFAALPTSGLLLVAIAVDRFVLICLARSDLVTPRSVRVALALTLLAGVVIGLPSVLTVSVYHSTPNSYENASISCLMGICKPSYTYIDAEDAWLYWVVIASLFIAMSVVLTAMYLMIFLRVLKARKKVGKWASGGGGGCGGRRPSSVDRKPAAATRNGAAPPALGQTRTAAAAASDEPPDGGANPAASLLSVPRGAATPGGGSGGGLTRTVAYNSSSLSNAPSAAGEQDGAETAAALGDGAPPRRGRKKRLPHVNTAVTLCLVTGTFIVAYLPVMVITLSGVCGDGGDASTASGAGCEPHNVYGVLWHFFFFNHVVNPIIYAFMNPRFKEALCAMLPRRGGRPRFSVDGLTSEAGRTSVDWHSGTAQ